MERRSFFRSLFGFATVVPAFARTGFAGAVTGAGVLAPGRGCDRRLLIQTSPLAGFQFHEGERLWARLRVGDALDLVREPRNRYDERAVRVEWKGWKLGYVPRRENMAVAQMLDRGEKLEARVVGLTESADPWERVRFEVGV